MTVTRAFGRGLLVLEALSESAPSGGATLADVSRAVGLDKATTARLLSTLIETGYVIRDSEVSNYRLTGKILRLTRNIDYYGDFRRAAHPILATLRDTTGESAHAGIYEAGHVMYIDKLESQRSVRLVSAVGEVMPVNTTALGKAMLAAMTAARREEVMASMTFDRRTEYSLTDREALLADLSAIRERGYSIDNEENEDQVLCVGAAVTDLSGEVLGAISISGPSYRTAPNSAQLGARCREAALAISETLANALRRIDPTLLNKTSD